MSVPSASASAATAAATAAAPTPTSPAATTSVPATPVAKSEPLVESEPASARGSGASTPTVTVGTGHMSLDRTLSPDVSAVERARLAARPIDAAHLIQHPAVQPERAAKPEEVRASAVLDSRADQPPATVEEQMQQEVNRKNLIGLFASARPLPSSASLRCVVLRL